MLWWVGNALLDAGLAQLPAAIDGLEPAMDIVNGSLAQVAGEAVPARR